MIAQGNVVAHDRNEGQVSDCAGLCAIDEASEMVWDAAAAALKESPSAWFCGRGV